MKDKGDRKVEMSVKMKANPDFLSDQTFGLLVNSYPSGSLHQRRDRWLNLMTRMPKQVDQRPRKPN